MQYRLFPRVWRSDHNRRPPTLQPLPDLLLARVLPSDKTAPKIAVFIIQGAAGMTG